MGLIVIIAVVIGLILYAKSKYKNQDKTTPAPKGGGGVAKEESAPALTYNFTPSTVIKDTEGNTIINKSADELVRIGNEIKDSCNNDVDGMEKSLPYFEAAAQKGDLFSIVMSMHYRSILSKLDMLAMGANPLDGCLDPIFWKDPLSNAQMARYWAEFILSSSSSFFTTENRKTAQETYDSTIYPLGVSLFAFKKHGDAAAVLSEIINAYSDTSIKAKVLYGDCLWEYAVSTENETLLRESLIYLKLAHTDRTYAKSNKKPFEEYIYFDAILNLAITYTHGYKMVVYKDITLSANALTESLNYLTDDRLKKDISDNLKKYKKGPDGKYTYEEPSEPSKSQPETSPMTFDDNVKFFAQVTECLANFLQKPVDFMVGVDEVNGRYNCFISLINSDCDEYNIALKYNKYPQSAIDYVGKYFDGKYISYETTLSAKPNTVPYHYSSLIEDVCSDCVSQDHRLNDPINGSFYIIGASYRR